MTNQELKHYGVLGMKWGKRKGSSSSSSSNVKNMSDDDLQKGIKRKSLENTYTKLNKNNSKLDKTKKLVDATSSAVNQAKRTLQDANPKATRKKMDLSNMTDKEMRDRINRANLEKQYNEMFGELEQPTISKGKQALDTTLDLGGSLLAIGSSSLAIALAIKELKG